MYFYCIKFMRQTEDDNTEHCFFCFAMSEEQAIERFCITSGYNKSCIITIYEV